MAAAKTTKAKISPAIGGASLVDAPADGTVVPQILPTKADDSSKTVYTIQDIEIVVDNNVFDDFELIGFLGEVEDNALKIPLVFKRIVGAEQAGKIMNLLRDKDTGRVPVEKALAFVMELINAISPNS